MKVIEKTEMDSLFAQTIDDRFTRECVSCHPDVTDTSCACKWRFVLGADGARKADEPET